MVDDGPLSFWINDFVDTTCKKTDREICSHGTHITLILYFQIQFFSEKRKYTFFSDVAQSPLQTPLR